jgi:polyisoprenoid-binding protein YceI
MSRIATVTTIAALALTAISPFAAALDKTAPAPVPAGVYTMDKLHTSLLFRVSHIGFSSYTARFTKLDATLDFDPSNLATSRVNVTIDPSSITADNVPSSFLDMLSGKDWLDAQTYPQMTFRSKSIEITGTQRFRILGELTLHGVTKPVVLDARYNGGYASHPFEPRARAGFSATGRFKRSDFGIVAGIPAPGTTMGVGDEVEVILESEFTGPAVAKN